MRTRVSRLRVNIDEIADNDTMLQAFAAAMVAELDVEAERGQHAGSSVPGLVSAFLGESDVDVIDAVVRLVLLEAVVHDVSPASVLDDARARLTAPDRPVGRVEFKPPHE